MWLCSFLGDSPSLTQVVNECVDAVVSKTFIEEVIGPNDGIQIVLDSEGDILLRHQTQLNSDDMLLYFFQESLVFLL